MCIDLDVVKMGYDRREKINHVEALMNPKHSLSLEEEEKPNLYETEDDKNKVVLYFTSLRGIRKTYEDCCCVRTEIVQIALGEEKPVCLPQVLIRGVHVGGMEEIKKLNDGGKLGEMLKGLPVCESVGACGCCGDPSVLWSTLLALFFPSSRQLCFFILSSSNLPPKHCF
ncbi:unnamed protein product [Brassica napus]|uniref:(rape) hypothetical protein n=1 Tax=Brassica napus TaxID=3708 RepID=A0A816LF81_BRANA|nr:unnamed protein product [Brassica napus]